MAAESGAPLPVEDQHHVRTTSPSTIMPSAKDIRAKNELFARKARETQSLRNAKGANRRGLLNEHKETQPTTSRWVQYLALFVLLLLGGGCTYKKLTQVVMEMLFLFMRASGRA